MEAEVTCACPAVPAPAKIRVLRSTASPAKQVQVLQLDAQFKLNHEPHRYRAPLELKNLKIGYTWIYCRSK